MAAMAKSLASIETDEPASGERLAAAVDNANEFRAEHGMAALRTDLDPPEEEFYRRARALGFRRRSR